MTEAERRAEERRKRYFGAGGEFLWDKLPDMDIGAIMIALQDLDRRLREIEAQNAALD